jgi:polar amino acid transport system substrate-binding protein
MSIRSTNRLHALMLAALLATPPGALAAAPLRLASDDWCPFICVENGAIADGFLIELTTRVMAVAGYRVEPVFMPLNRAIMQTGAGSIDGVYAPPLDRRLRPSVALATSRACFYTRPDESWTYRGIDSLKTVAVGIIDEYGYDNGPMDAYIARNRQHPALLAPAFGTTAGTINLRKLLGGRFRVLLEHSAVMDRLARTSGVTGQLRQAGCLEQSLPLTIGFSADDARANALVRAVADGLRQVNASGQLHALQQRYGIQP